MYRKIMNFLETWRENKHRKPLILQGARQVGKTTMLKHLARGEGRTFWNSDVNIMTM